MGAPGPHDFAVRVGTARLQHLHVHRIPHHVRDDAYAPLAGSGTARVKHDFRKYERTIFFARWLDKSKKLESGKPN
jgi:hypothetical protein